MKKGRYEKERDEAGKKNRVGNGSQEEISGEAKYESRGGADVGF